MAVRGGFEPPMQFPTYTLSRRAPSTTRTSHRINKKDEIILAFLGVFIKIFLVCKIKQEFYRLLWFKDQHLHNVGNLVFVRQSLATLLVCKYAMLMREHRLLIQR